MLFITSESDNFSTNIFSNLDFSNQSDPSKFLKQ